jgi:predicted amidophosphoribosyltransferase
MRDESFIYGGFWDRCRLHFICYYIPSSNCRLSKSLLKFFKENNLKHVQAWNEWIANCLEDVEAKNAVVIRVLGSGEQYVSNTSNKPLDIIARTVASHLGCEYSTTLLYKTRKTKPLKNLKTKAEREAEVNGVFRLADETIDLNDKTIIIVDDILTSGTVVKEVIRAIREKYPKAKFKVITLARTKRDNNANKKIEIKSDFLKNYVTLN